MDYKFYRNILFTILHICLINLFLGLNSQETELWLMGWLFWSTVLNNVCFLLFIICLSANEGKSLNVIIYNFLLEPRLEEQILIIIMEVQRKLPSHQPTGYLVSCTCSCAVWRKQVPFSLAIGNIKLSHERFSKHWFSEQKEWSRTKKQKKVRKYGKK